MDPAFSEVIRDVSDLRALYREPSEFVAKKKMTRMDELTRRFVAGSPFCLIATADASGTCDVSPRGGPPGFVRCLDDQRLVIPDLSGNNLLDSLTNIVANPHVGLLLLIPGRDETLRVEGRSWLTTAPDIIGLWDDELRRPRVAIGVEVNTVYTHCAKSFRRGRVWDPAAWAELDAPDTCEIGIERFGLDLNPQDVRAALEASYAKALADERRDP